MRKQNTTFLAAALLVLVAAGCSKPEDKLVGKWTNDKSANSIEFNQNHTGAIFQRSDARMPPNIPFKWSMLDERQFKVEVGAGGASGPSAVGHVDGDTLTLENDTFKKAK